MESSIFFSCFFVLFSQTQIYWPRKPLSRFKTFWDFIQRKYPNFLTKPICRIVQTRSYPFVHVVGHDFIESFMLLHTLIFNSVLAEIEYDFGSLKRKLYSNNLEWYSKCPSGGKIHHVSNPWCELYLDKNECQVYNDKLLYDNVGSSLMILNDFHVITIMIYSNSL